MKKRTFGWILLAGFILALGWCFYSYFTQGVIHSLLQNDPTSLIESLRSLGVLGILLFVLLVVLENVVAPMPPFVLYVAGGAIYGAFWGGLIALLGNAMGSALAFIIARKLGRDWIEKKVPKNVGKQFDKFTDKYGGWAIFLLRVNPLTSTDLFSYLAGFTNMRFRTFIIGTTLGLAPSIILQSYLGDFFSSSPILFNLFLVIGVFYVAMFVFLFFLFKKNKKKEIKLTGK
ncbi:MAG: TVP38/TMEM64 family protein [Nanoarchaeota archaeon]|nr:TVP38/TMEM64 family protein [Nanoarchaeota archaeon]